MDAIRKRIDELLVDQNPTPYELDFVYDIMRRMTEWDWKREEGKGLVPSEPAFDSNAMHALKTCREWEAESYRRSVKKWEDPWVEPNR